MLLFYFIASEVGIANYIQRVSGPSAITLLDWQPADPQHFDWADNNLFVDEIPALRDSSRTAFFFGGHDIIIDAARARRYLERRKFGLEIRDPSQDRVTDGSVADPRWCGGGFALGRAGRTWGWTGWRVFVGGHDLRGDWIGALLSVRLYQRSKR